MISVSRLLCDAAGLGDGLRYEASARSQRAGAREGSGPVVVWNVTPACNLRCTHCYYDAGPGSPGLPTTEALAVLDDLAAFRVPVVLFSGGEPLTHPDLPCLIERAVGLGMRAVVSTNGTLITADKARMLRDLGVGYVGVSLDGVGEANDRMRGVPGAFERALAGVRNCLEAGVRVGLRFTMTRDNVGQLGAIFDLVAREGIPRVCFYHLVYSGRGAALTARDLGAGERRAALDLIARRTVELHGRGLPVEVLTVDNHADGPYLYLWALRHRPERAAAVPELLRRNGGNRSGSAIAALDHAGNVYPDQFSRHWPLGNVRRRPFSAIWADDGQSLLGQLRRRKELLRGRCRRCAWLEVCNGNFRARAEAAGDMWGDDPACYLTEEEIARAGGTERWTA